jgi:signal recognition particle receptor subunit alpha
MLDCLYIFTKGGALLWAFQTVAALKGSPINALIRTYLLEERSGESSFTYSPPSGAPYTLKWTMHNVRAISKRAGTASAEHTATVGQ